MMCCCWKSFVHILGVNFTKVSIDRQWKRDRDAIINASHFLCHTHKIFLSNNFWRDRKGDDCVSLLTGLKYILRLINWNCPKCSHVSCVVCLCYAFYKSCRTNISGDIFVNLKTPSSFSNSHIKKRYKSLSNMQIKFKQKDITMMKISWKSFEQKVCVVLLKCLRVLIGVRYN